MEIYSTYKVGNKKVYDTTPMYSELEREHLGKDIPTYNFDTSLEIDNSGACNHRILFSTGYNHDEKYRSLFALSPFQIRSIISMLEDSLVQLQETLDNNRELNTLLYGVIGRELYKSFKTNNSKKFKFSVYHNNLYKDIPNTFLMFPRIYSPEAPEKKLDYSKVLISIDSELKNYFQIRKFETLEEFKVDSKFLSTVEMLIRKNFAILIADHFEDSLSSSEKEKFINFISNHDKWEFKIDEDDSYFINTAKEVIDANNKALNIFTDYINNLKNTKDVKPLLNKMLPTPINSMSDEEMDKFSKEFLKEIKEK